MKPKGVRGQKRKAVLNESSDDEVVFNVPESKKVKTDEEQNEEQKSCDIKEQTLTTKDPEPLPEIKTEEDEIEFKPRRSPNGYILADPLPKGLVIQDQRKKRWKIGKSVGLGGFGEIYSAALYDGNPNSPEDYVVKVEPHHNGPLFVELNFYCRAASTEEIQEFARTKNLSHIGIPDLKGSGSFIFRNRRLRFIVIPKYGKDLQTVLEELPNQTLSVQSASYIAFQMINCFEYLHSKGYVHKDLKGANILYPVNHDYSNGAFGNVYLVDFGLTSKYNYLGFHKPFQEDQRSAHEGTLEYTSRDSHLGCVSRRGDIEVLLYVLIDWLGGHLPWDKEEGLKPTQIQNMKIEAFQDIKTFLTSTFKHTKCPSFIEDLMYLVTRMPFEEAPDYDNLRSLFTPYFDDPSQPLKLIDEDDSDIEFALPKTRAQRGPSKRRGLSKLLKRKRSLSQPWTPTRMGVYNDRKKQLIRQLSEDSLTNPTYAMVKQLKEMKARNMTPAHSSPRRKGLVAKRRLKSNLVGSEKALDGSNKDENLPVEKTLRKSPRGSGSPLRMLPRRNSKDSAFKHLVQLINPIKLVKSMFANPEE